MYGLVAVIVALFLLLLTLTTIFVVVCKKLNTGESYCEYLFSLLSISVMQAGVTCTSFANYTV